MDDITWLRRLFIVYFLCCFVPAPVPATSASSCRGIERFFPECIYQGHAMGLDGPLVQNQLPEFQSPLIEFQSPLPSPSPSPRAPTPLLLLPQNILSEMTPGVEGNKSKHIAKSNDKPQDRKTTLLSTMARNVDRSTAFKQNRELLVAKNRHKASNIHVNNNDPFAMLLLASNELLNRGNEILFQIRPSPSPSPPPQLPPLLNHEVYRQDIQNHHGELQSRNKDMDYYNKDRINNNNKNTDSSQSGRKIHSRSGTERTVAPQNSVKNNKGKTHSLKMNSNNNNNSNSSNTNNNNSNTSNNNNSNSSNTTNNNNSNTNNNNNSINNNNNNNKSHGSVDKVIQRDSNNTKSVITKGNNKEKHNQNDSQQKRNEPILSPVLRSKNPPITKQRHEAKIPQEIVARSPISRRVVDSESKNQHPVYRLLREMFGFH